MKISLASFQWSLDPLDQTKIHTSESQLPFDTEYEIHSPKTGVTKIFRFSHATGPEFDPKTRWVYHTGSKLDGDEFTLIVHNEPHVTMQRSMEYLKGKLVKM
jgi:hypothetical protein